MRRFSLTFLGVVVGAAWLLNAIYAIRMPIWSPRDEIAHFDYIDRLSEGIIPDARSSVSAHTLLLSSKYFTWIKPMAFDGSASSMGIAGKSYEAGQPPLYYASLAIPHRLLKHRLSPVSEVRALRMLSLSYVFVAVILVFLTAARVASIAPSLATPVYIAVLVFSLTNIKSYSSLGNDSLSALCGALVLFLFVRAIAVPARYIYLVSLAFTVSISVLLVKLTNAALMVAPIALAMLPIQHAAPRESFRRAAAVLGPLAPIAIYGFYRLLFSPAGLGSYAAREYFASWVTGIPSTPLFVLTLLRESLSLDHIGVGVPPAIGVALGLALLFAFFDFALTTTTWPAYASMLVGGALGIAAVTFVAAAALNLWSPGVHWHAFRHYVAVLPFLVLAALSPLRRLPPWAAMPLLFASCLGASCLLVRLASSLLQ